MAIKEALSTIVQGQNLSQAMTYAVAQEMIAGEAKDAQMGALLATLALKGETVAEIAGLAQAMQEAAIQVQFPFPVVDTCGAGGDGQQTFNISTTVAFVVAACGAKVAKHGNRAATSSSGSADVLEALGANLELTAQEVEHCVHEVGIGFFFAQRFHPAMKHVMPTRKALGIRTVFNMLGPLLSPAAARHQVIGIPNPDLAEKLIKAIQLLGNHEHVLVVSGTDGLDEVSTAAPTQVYSYQRKQDTIQTSEITPESVGLDRAPLSALQVDSKDESATLIRSILAGTETGAPLTIVLLNSAAALIAADIVADWKQGIQIAHEAIASGAAREKLEKFVQFTNTTHLTTHKS